MLYKWSFFIRITAYQAWGIQRLAWEGRTTSGQCCQSTSLLFWFVDCVRGALVTNRPLRYSLQNVGNGRWAGLHGELFAAEGSDWLEHAFWGWWLCSMVVEEGRKLDLQYFIQSFRSFNHFLTKRHAQNEPVWMKHGCFLLPLDCQDNASSVAGCKQWLLGWPS